MNRIRVPLLARIAVAPALALALSFAACESDKERIEDQNNAARTAAAEETADDPEPEETAEPTRDASTRPRSVSVFDLRAGDCLTEDALSTEDGEEQERTEIVDCNTADAYGRVSKLHLIEGDADADFPGDEAILAIAEAQCATPGLPYTYFTPTEVSWSQGDRAITCIESAAFNYVVGSCIGGEPDDFRVLPCDLDGDRIFGDVVRIVDVTADHGPEAPLPPDTLWDEIFTSQCASDADYFLFPTADTWEFGDRLVICVLTR
jgi:hypothetical protein